MKFVLLAALCLLSCAVAQRADIKPGDFRNEFDQLLAEWAYEQIAEAEHFLLHLTEQIEEFKKSPNKSDQEKLLNEIQGMLGLTEGNYHYFVEELKRTDLNTVEQFILESGKTSAEILIKDLQKAEQDVKAIHV